MESDRGGHRPSGAGAPEPRTRCSRRSGSRPSRGRSASSSRPICARSPTPSRTRRSSSRPSASCSSTGSSRRVELPFPVGAGVGRGRAGGQGHADEAVRQAGRRGDLQGPRPQEDRGREAAAGRPRHRGDPPDRLRGRRLAAHARLGALHPRPDADHDACSRSAPPRRGSGSTISRSRPTAGTCTTTTSRPTRSARPASCAGRSAATSATARSRSGRSSR